MVTVYKAMMHMGRKFFADGCLHWAADGLSLLQALGLDIVHQYHHNPSEAIRWKCASRIWERNKLKEFCSEFFLFVGNALILKLRPDIYLELFSFRIDIIFFVISRSINEDA
jgi:hypothetical protein